MVLDSPPLPFVFAATTEYLYAVLGLRPVSLNDVFVDSPTFVPSRSTLYFVAPAEAFHVRSTVVPVAVPARPSGAAGRLRNRSACSLAWAADSG